VRTSVGGGERTRLTTVPKTERSADAESSDLLERSGQVAALDEALAAVVKDSRGRVQFVGGEAGVGKTALLRHFCDARGESARVLWGSCDSLFTPRPLGPLQDVAEQTQGELQALVETAPRPDDVATTLIRELTARAPTILVLEDLHWADEATLDVVRLLGRRIETVPTLVLASYRDDELDRGHPLRVVLGELAAARGVSRLSVPPLSAAGVAKLAEPHGFDPDELFRTTGGNSFFVTEVLAAGRDEMPSTVRDAVLARVARLSPEARTVVEAVAVAPQEMEHWLVDAVAGDAGQRLDDCLAAGVLVPRPGAVAFRHELARLAVEESLPPNARIALHSLALAALTSPPKGLPDVARLAHHADAAGDDEAVQRFAPEAAVRAAALGAHREAASQYARALRFAEGLALDERARLLGCHARECTLIGEWTEAIAVHREALECHRSLADARAEGNTLREMAWVLWAVGHTPEAEAAASRAVDVLESGGRNRDLILAYCGRSDLYRYARDFEQAVDSGARALKLAREIDDSDAVVHAVTTMAMAEYMGDVDRGREQLEYSIKLAREAGLEQLAVNAMCILVFGAVDARLHTLAASHIDAAITYCSEHDLGGFQPFMIVMRAQVELEQGRLSHAAESASAVVAGVTSGSPSGRGIGPGTAYALAVIGRVRARRGEPEAWAPLDEALRLAEGREELIRLKPVAVARAEAAWLEGRDELVPAATDAAFALAQRVDDDWAIGELAYWRWRAGIEEEVPAGAAEPYAAQIAGDWRRAAELWTELGCPYETALALADSDDDGLMREALESLQQLGARPAAAIVARRLRERGARGLPRGPRPRTRENVANLTPRQVEVLELVSHGLHNGEIAERLFLSERTVDHHVSAILGKLGVASRGQAAAEAARLGIAGPS
jgi:DNA-binding CsgD family transcriptional regulator/tetratricopeptide (TPR) repeat protein